MTKLSIEIHGTGIHNRGAELMAIAVAEKVAARYPDAQIIVPLNLEAQEIWSVTDSSALGRRLAATDG